MLTSSTGLVLRIDAKSCHVEVAGQTLRLPLRGKLFEKRSEQKRPIAVGDRVRVTLGAGGGAIEEVLPRSSKLGRSSAGDDGREQVLAANINLVLVVASITEPPFLPLLVDRALAGAEREGIEAALVLTKLDRDREGRAAALADIYRGIDYRVLLTSIEPGQETTEALAELGDLLHGHESMLIGPSGVGKSSLLNAVVADADCKIGSLGRIRLGRHTTSHTQLIPLPGGGHVLDTPGIRNFGLFALQPGEMIGLFRELRPLAARCGFRNCNHRREPDCAILAALQRGEVAESRLRSFWEVLPGARISR